MQLEDLEPRHALTIAGLGVAGDSWSDEYAAEVYNYAKNWPMLLKSERGIDLGANVNFLPPDDPSGNPIEFRRTGTAFNYAFTGAKALDLLIEAQDINLADQFSNGEVSHAVLMIGNVDFAPGGEVFTNIANGTWTQTDIDNQVTFLSINIDAAIATLSNVAIKGLIATIPDPTMTPQGQTLFTAAGRTKVRDAVNAVNTKIKESAAKYHQPVIDLNGLATTLLGTSSSPAASRTIGGNVYNVAGGTSGINLFVQGGVLPHTVYQGLVANLVIEGLNSAYNENIAKLTEQQIVTLAGQTYGGADTFPINYSNFIIQPPVTVFVDFGQTSTLPDDFVSRMKEVAQALHISPLAEAPVGQPSELANLKANIVSRLQNSFAGTNVNFTSTQPADTRFETLKLGRLSSSAAGALTSLLGQSPFDWLNSSEVTTGLVFPDLIPDLNGATKIADLPRADQLRYLENILTFYSANEIGRGMGLSAADAFGYSQITSANAAATGGVQFQDYMSGDPALGFNTNTFNGTPTFRFSPLAQAKLQFGRWLTKPTLATTAEVGTAHGTTATAQTLTLTQTTNASLRAGIVRGAAISASTQKDLYKIPAAAVGDLITAQTFATGVYPGSPTPINTVIRILAADGTTVLATSDDTLLGNNSIGQAGSTNVDSDSLVMNYVVATAGDIYVEVTANVSGTATGNYDLLVGRTVSNQFPWQNQSNPLNVNNNSTGPAVTAFDAILVINELNNPQFMNPVTFVLPVPAGSVAPPPYLDVDGNNRVTAFDAIQVITYLNLNPIGGPEFIPSGGEAISESSSSSGAASGNSSRSSSSPTVTPYQPTSTSGSLLASSRLGAVSALNANESLAWLLLNPLSAAAAEEVDSHTCAQEENDAALQDLLGSDE